MSTLAFPARFLAAAVSTVCLGGLAACGGGSQGADAPTDAKAADFCKVAAGVASSDPATIKDKLLKVGTPADIDKAARAGFEVMIDKAGAKDISDSEKEKVSAFVSYANKTCAATP